MRRCTCPVGFGAQPNPDCAVHSRHTVTGPTRATAAMVAAVDQRDRLIRLLSRLEVAVTQHRAVKLAGVDTSDDADDHLYDTHRKVMTDWREGRG